jgi:hypothetical protein
METLRLLANCVKHASQEQPEAKLLTHLKLPPKPEGKLIAGYSSLQESNSFREGLAQSLHLPSDADYCTIADKLICLAEKFLNNVRLNTRRARSDRVPLNKFVS